MKDGDYVKTDDGYVGRVVRDGDEYTPPIRVLGKTLYCVSLRTGPKIKWWYYAHRLTPLSKREVQIFLVTHALTSHGT